MFPGRKEGMLGDEPVIYRVDSYARKRRNQFGIVPAHPTGSDFFGTSSYGVSKGLARKREVDRLFSRMRNELVEIAQEFAEDSTQAANTVRRGIFVEMIVASEFVSDELDCVIAALCQAGAAAKSRGATTEQLDNICKQAVSFARLRNRVDELQHDLESMVELTLRPIHQYAINATLNFDPIVQNDHTGEPFVTRFLKAVEAAVEVMTELASKALQNKDFETVAEVCSCNVQLTNFLSDAQSILSEA